MDFELTGITWKGPSIDDPGLLDDLPPELAQILGRVNGFILHGGALHVRGAVLQPPWHSLRQAWRDPKQSIGVLYRLPLDAGLPFAQDAVGNQFLLREGVVWRLAAETADLASMGTPLVDFLVSAGRDPQQVIGTTILMRFQSDGNRLTPGHLLRVRPSLRSDPRGEGGRIDAQPCADLIRIQAKAAREYRGGSDRVRIHLDVEE